jgi:hypothetical protein
MLSGFERRGQGCSSLSVCSASLARFLPFPLVLIGVTHERGVLSGSSVYSLSGRLRRWLVALRVRHVVQLIRVYCTSRARVNCLFHHNRVDPVGAFRPITWGISHTTIDITYEDSC